MLATPNRVKRQPAEHAATCQLRTRPTALLFDLADVIYDASMWQRWLLQLLGRLGLHTHYRAFFRAFETEHLVEVYLGKREYWDALGDYLRAVGMTSGQIDEVPRRRLGEVSTV